jgi:hypothetical protein
MGMQGAFLVGEGNGGIVRPEQMFLTGGSSSFILFLWAKPTKATGTGSLVALLTWSDVRAYRRRGLVQGIDEQLMHMLREVCKEHQAEIEELDVVPEQVHLASERRSPMWHSSSHEAGQKSFFPPTTSSISCLDANIANPVDQEVLCYHHGRSTACSYQRVH